MGKREVFVLFIISITILLSIIPIVNAGSWDDFITGVAVRRLVGGEESAPNCITNANCQRGEYCSGRRCTQIDGFCENNNDCKINEICNSNECKELSSYTRRSYSVTNTSEGTSDADDDSCTVNSDCESGEFCARGICRKFTRYNSPIPTCSRDSECGSDQTCEGRICVERRRSTPPLRPPILCGALVTNSGTIVLSEFDPIINETCSSTGINLRGNDITLDCNGHTLRGMSYAETGGYYRTGISTFTRDEVFTNITIKNCNIEGFTNGISFTGVENGLIINNNFDGLHSSGIKFQRAKNNLISENIFPDGESVHFSYNSTGNMIRDNYFGTDDNRTYNYFTSASDEMDDSINYIYRNDFFGDGVTGNHSSLRYCYEGETNYYYSNVEHEQRRRDGCSVPRTPWTEVRNDLALNLISCGSEVVEDIVLTERDPITQTRCEGDGIIVPDYVYGLNIDCNGLTISGTPYRPNYGKPNTGIHVNGSGHVNIKNCNIDGFSNGIKYENTLYGMLDFNNLTNIFNFALYLKGSEDLTFRFNIVENSGGILFEDTRGAKVSSNFFSTSHRPYLQVGLGTEQWTNKVGGNDFFGSGVIDDVHGILYYCGVGPRNNAIGNYYAESVPEHSRKTTSACGDPIADQPWTMHGANTLENMKSALIEGEPAFLHALDPDEPVCVMAPPEYCYEGATCCFGGYWRCNNGDGSSACPAIPTGEVLDDENETRPQLHIRESENRTFERLERLGPPFRRNILDLVRRIFGNGGDGEEDETADPSTCSGTAPSCYEGASCCPDGRWSCNHFDGTPNCPADALHDEDSDGYHDGIDNCIEVYNPDQSDTDSNGVGDVCEDTDDETCISHNDCDSTDKCYLNECISNINWIVAGVRDRDYDGIINSEDNCQREYNPEQIDSDRDGEGDACEEILNNTVDVPPGTVFHYEHIDTPEKQIVVINDLDVDTEYNHWNRMIDFTISSFEGEELFRFQPRTDFDFCLLPNWRCSGDQLLECDSAGMNCAERIPTELDLIDQEIFWLYPNPETHNLSLEEIRGDPHYNLNFFETPPIHESLTEYNVVVRTGRWEDVSFTLSEATGTLYPIGRSWSQKEEFWYYCDENLYYSRYTFPVGGEYVASHESGTIVIRLSDFIPSDGLFELGGYCYS